MNALKTLTKQTNNVVSYGRRNAPTILTLIGVCGFAMSIVKTAKAAPKAVEAKKKLAETISEESTVKEKVVETVKVYAPVYAEPIIFGTASAVCILGANHINNKRLAAVTAAYSLCDTNFKEYRKKVIEKFGEKKDQAVQDEIAAEHIKNNPISEEDDLIAITTGGTLFMDSISKQYFRSTREDVMKAAKNFERRLISGEDFLDFNEWLNTLDEACTAGHLQNTPIGYNVGFNSTNGLDIYYSVQPAANGEPCTVVEYHTPPTYDMYL